MREECVKVIEFCSEISEPPSSPPTKNIKKTKTNNNTKKQKTQPKPTNPKPSHPTNQSTNQPTRQSRQEFRKIDHACSVEGCASQKATFHFHFFIVFDMCIANDLRRRALLIDFVCDTVAVEKVVLLQELPRES